MSWSLLGAINHLSLPKVTSPSRPSTDNRLTPLSSLDRIPATSTFPLSLSSSITSIALAFLFGSLDLSGGPQRLGGRARVAEDGRRLFNHALPSRRSPTEDQLGRMVSIPRPRTTLGES